MCELYLRFFEHDGLLGDGHGSFLVVVFPGIVEGLLAKPVLAADGVVRIA